MAENLAAKYEGELPVRVFDPTCGAGSLLIAIASKFPILGGFSETLKHWGRYLAGCDIHQEFVDATHLRIALLALRRGARAGRPPSLSQIRKLLPRIYRADACNEKKAFNWAKLILLNPPFNRTIPQKARTWCTGRTSNAALIFEHCVSNCNENTRILSILPEVLRSGSLYDEWRRVIAKNVSVNSIESQGIFDSKTDIDVFILDVNVTADSKDQTEWCELRTRGSRLEQFFHLSVGPVVPFRLDNRGPDLPFIHARVTKPWCELKNLSETVKFSGTTFRGPFVVIRRTSRPGDQHRTVASIVTSPANIAVENHLIICKPLDGKVSTCRKLLQELKKPYVNEWLNSKLRCRHLTVRILKQLPLKWNDHE